MLLLERLIKRWTSSLIQLDNSSVIECWQWLTKNWFHVKCQFRSDFRSTVIKYWRNFGSSPLLNSGWVRIFWVSTWMAFGDKGKPPEPKIQKRRLVVSLEATQVENRVSDQLSSEYTELLVLLEIGKKVVESFIFYHFKIIAFIFYKKWEESRTEFYLLWF